MGIYSPVWWVGTRLQQGNGNLYMESDSATYMDMIEMLSPTFGYYLSKLQIPSHNLGKWKGNPNMEGMLLHRACANHLHAMVLGGVKKTIMYIFSIISVESWSKRGWMPHVAWSAPKPC